MDSKEYERQAYEFLKQHLHDELPDAKINVFPSRLYESKSGHAHQIDVSAELEVLGTKVLILGECKFWGHTVQVDDVMVLDSRLKDIGAHKGLLISTVGFQKGAIKFAKSHGIGLVLKTDKNWKVIVPILTAVAFSFPKSAKSQSLSKLAKTILAITGAVLIGALFKSTPLGKNLKASHWNPFAVRTIFRKVIITNETTIVVTEPPDVELKSNSPQNSSDFGNLAGEASIGNYTSADSASIWIAVLYFTDEEDTPLAPPLRYHVLKRDDGIPRKWYISGPFAYQDGGVTHLTSSPSSIVPPGTSVKATLYFTGEAPMPWFAFDPNGIKTPTNIFGVEIRGQAQSQTISELILASDVPIPVHPTNDPSSDVFFCPDLHQAVP